MNKKENLIGVETGRIIHKVEVGRFMYEIFGYANSEKVILDDGVAAFITSKEFKRPEFKENINLRLFNLKDLGFSEPSLSEAILKKVKRMMPDLDYCPMETAMALAEAMFEAISEGKIGDNEERTYYVISPKQEDNTTPDCLGVKVSKEGKIKVFGWSIEKPISLDSVLVFSQKLEKEDVHN